MAIPKWITVNGKHVPIFEDKPQEKKEIINPQRDEFEMEIMKNLPKYKGTIAQADLDDYGEKYDLPTGEVKMVKYGEWVSGGRKIGAWVFADGSHANLQFTRAKDGTFYLETVD